MIAATLRTLFLAAFLPLSALAQLQLFQFDGTTERPVGAIYDMGSAAPAGNIETRFRVRNSGVASVTLTNLSVAGASFSFSSKPSLPYIVAPASLVDFKILFSPASTGSYTGTLLVNALAVTLRGTTGTAVAGAVLSLGQTLLADGATIDFGKTLTGTSVTQSLTLTNPSSAPITISSITVMGSEFNGPVGVSTPLVLAPGQSVLFTIVFIPSSAQSSTGTLVVDQRTFQLTGLGALPSLQLFQFDGTTEKPVGQLYDAGTAAPGDSIETRFRVRNPGVASVTLTSLSIMGASFRFSAQPSLPYIIAPASFVDFKVMFSPTGLGTYSANLLVNTISVTLRGTAVASAVLMLGQTVLAAGATIDFGQTEPGTSVSLTLTLSNPSPASVAVSSIAVTGPDFSAPVGVSAPLTLSPGQSVPFTIRFAPSVAHSSQGILSVDQRSFNLVGLAVNPPLPKASIQFDTSGGISARQAKVSIQLASASRVAGTGTLTLEFRSSVQGATDDPAIQFLSGPKLIATVTIAAGDSIAKFGSSADLAFQTGTTAGTILFTLKLPNDTVEATFAIPAAAVYFDITTATRRVSDLDVSLIGFDNTHSASQLAFTFYDSSGRVLLPGVIRVDATPDFKRYFDSNVAAGSFALRATFPVTGGAVSLPITGATNTSPIQITTSKPHGFQNGDMVIISSVNGNTNANGTWGIANVTNTSFTLGGSYGNGAYVSGSGIVTGDAIQVAGVDVEMTNTVGVTKTQRIPF
jgi:P pilus assembly chaperone PapD